MQKLIVTSALFTGYSTIFSLDGDTLDLRYKRNIKFRTNLKLNMDSIPFDLKYEILERVVLTLVKEGKIRKAMDTLLLSNSVACSIFYTKYIGYYNLSRLEIIKHLISMFYLIHDIHANLYFNDSTSSDELFLSLFCRNSTIDILQDKLWPFGQIAHSFMDSPPGLVNTPADQDEKIIKVIVGGAYSDIVWLAGKEKDGVISTNYLKGPIVILEIYTNGYGIMQTLYEKRTTFLLKFVKLLKLALGKHSGVYTTFPIEGFVGLVSEVV